MEQRKELEETVSDDHMIGPEDELNCKPSFNYHNKTADKKHGR